MIRNILSWFLSCLASMHCRRRERFSSPLQIWKGCRQDLNRMPSRVRKQTAEALRYPGRERILRMVSSLSTAVLKKTAHWGQYLMQREMNCQIRFIVCYFRRRRWWVNNIPMRLRAYVLWKCLCSQTLSSTS